LMTFLMFFVLCKSLRYLFFVYHIQSAWAGIALKTRIVGKKTNVSVLILNAGIVGLNLLNQSSLCSM
jgi:hypothetical protein